MQSEADFLIVKRVGDKVFDYSSRIFGFTDEDSEGDILIDSMRANGDAQTVRIPARLVSSVALNRRNDHGL
jgi:hypothetical protein